MPKAHPRALRIRVVKAYLADPNATYQSIGERFLVGPASVNRWVQKFRRTKDVAEEPRGVGDRRRLVTDEHLDFMRETLKEFPDSTIAELRKGLKEEFGIELAMSTVHRHLRKSLGLTRKRGLPGRPPGTGKTSSRSGASSSKR